MTGKNYVTLKGCDTCNTAEKNGLCKDNKCIDAGSKLGKKIVKEANVNAYPECVVKKVNGSWQKCKKKELNRDLKKYVR